MTQLSHPCHGALFFNAARANGHDFWTSVPYAVFGSLMWEYLMENEPPSYNDIANTPITGTLLGEIFWRVSDLIIDETAAGTERFLRELSPMSMIGIYKEVDIILNQVYKLSATMATAQIMDATSLSPGVDLQSTLGFSAILMGATNSEYADDHERDHKVGPGLGAKAGVALSLGNHLDVHAQYKRYWIHALSGAKSDQFVGLLNAGVGAWFSSQLKFTLEAVLYERYGRYRDYENTKSFNTGLRFFITWRI
ncbi:MAG: DUF3943 domain-containing protein [Bacteroidetes bacterium]|nr:DUF3943 domain-containing protein [Bacteroidota bacterium]